MKNWLKTSLYFLLAIILLIFLHWLGWLKPLEKVGQRILNPVQRFTYNLSQMVASPTRYFASQNEVLAENSKLRQENLDLKLKVAELSSYQQENEILTESFVIYSGMGKLFLNGFKSKDIEISSLHARGYLDEKILKYIHQIYFSKFDIDLKEYKNNLTKEAMKMLDDLISGSK